MTRSNASFCGALAIALTAVLWTASPAAAQYRYMPGGYMPRDYYQNPYRQAYTYQPRDYYRPDIRYQAHSYYSLPNVYIDPYSYPSYYYGGGGYYYNYYPRYSAYGYSYPYP